MRTKMKKALVLMCAVTLAALFPLCAMAQDYTAGTYTAVADGNNGPVEVAVSFSDERVESVTIVKHQETAGLSDPAFERIPKTIVENQTLAVDTVSGATMTSKAILAAVEDCVTQAGGDVQALKAQVIEKAKGEDEEMTADVIIVGGGGAGIAAASAAAQSGSSVILIEKMSALGGNTILSGSALNAADPELQNAMQINEDQIATLKDVLDYDESIFGPYAQTLAAVKAQITEYLKDPSYLFDSVEWHIIQTYVEGIRTDEKGNTASSDFELVHTMASNVLDTVHWLNETVGVEFYTDRLTTPPGSMWVRGHAAVSNAQIFEAASAYIENNGGKICKETRATELIMEDGRCTGVVAMRTDGSTLTLHADKAVVLACGGFAGNPTIVREYNTFWPAIPDNTSTTNAPGNTGDGITMGVRVGAAVVDMGFSQMVPDFGILLPAESFIYINEDCKRFVNEYATRDVLSAAHLSQTGKTWALFDYNQALTNNSSYSYEQVLEKYVDTNMMLMADTIPELAQKMGVDAAALQSEIDKYNSYVESGVDPDQGRAVFGLKIEQGPFFASPSKAKIHHTMGGLKINTQAQVINTQGNVIEGLYAAGEVTGGIHGGNRLGGNALSDCFTFGRIAGQNAAAQQ